MRKDGKKGNRNAVGADLQEHESIGGEQVENPPHIDEALHHLLISWETVHVMTD